MRPITDQLLFLRQVPIFREMTFGQIKRLLPYFERQHYPHGAVIYREGEIGQRFYILVQGTVRIVKDYGKPGEQELAWLKSKDFFGEMGIFEGKPHLATVIANEDVCVFTLPAETFKQLLAEHPTMVLGMGRELSARIRRRTRTDHRN